jgi:ABC-type maltose transport system permease subunit
MRSRGGVGRLVLRLLHVTAAGLIPLPIVGVFLLLQKYSVNGLAGAIK